jgi:FtsZ-binding cell division protein ZapB
MPSHQRVRFDFFFPFNQNQKDSALSIIIAYVVYHFVTSHGVFVVRHIFVTCYRTLRQQQQLAHSEQFDDSEDEDGEDNMIGALEVANERIFKMEEEKFVGEGPGGESVTAEDDRMSVTESLDHSEPKITPPLNTAFYQWIQNENWKAGVIRDLPKIVSLEVEKQRNEDALRTRINELERQNEELRRENHELRQRQGRAMQQIQSFVPTFDMGDFTL